VLICVSEEKGRCMDGEQSRMNATLIFLR
jgi:hypothetical protein